MLKLRINPIVAKDLKNIRDYIAEDNEEYAAKTIKEIYGKFENLQMFPGMGSDLSKRVSFRTDYKYAIWEDYVIIYKVGNEYKDICFPITPECRKQLNDAVLGAYEQALTQSQNSMAKHHEMQQAPEGQAMDMTGM